MRCPPLVRLLNETIYILSGEVLRDGVSSKKLTKLWLQGNKFGYGHPAKNRKILFKKLAGINARPSEASNQNVK